MYPQRRRRRFWTYATVLLATTAIAQSALAAPGVVDVRAGLLRDALADLAQKSRVDILYTADLVRGRRNSAVKGRLTTEQTLGLLLTGSGVGYRLTPDGVFVLFELPRREIADPGDGAISEVLVLGRRTQNADIRRTENDIQPYKVVGPRHLAVAAQDNVDQYLRERLPANGQVISPSQYVNNTGAPNSAIDLRGVGLQRTLVLVDGRRLPSLPSRTAGLEQSDVNAIPLGAIARIETLTATAGGIHGPTAIGGVVNLVLKRDYRGADLTVVSGISSRGDAGRGRVEARIGFTPDEGRTDVMLAASASTARRLKVGQRDYARRSLEWQARNSPAAFLLQLRPVNAITVRSGQNEPLRLDAAYGGTVLAGGYTFLPLDFQGTDQEKAAALVANAGRLPTDPAVGMAGDDTSLVSTPKTYSVLFNARHRINDRLEAFVDGLDLRDEARAFTPRAPNFGSTSQANAAGNLFANSVFFYFPVEGLVDEKTTTIDVRRLTGGLIATLPRDWRASADYTVGRSLMDYRRDGMTIGSGFSSALGNGLPGARGQTPVVPLGDFATLQSATMAYAVPTGEHLRLTTQFSSGVVRAAGPLLALPGGPLTATVLGEIRRERMPQSDYLSFGQGGALTTATPDRVQLVTSGYVELRAPLAPRDVRIAPLRGLELQLALRRDGVKTTFPDTILTGVSTQLVRTAVRRQADVFTLGVRTFPTDWLMLRASAATGETPPDMTHLQQLGIIATNNGAYPFTDPKRGGRPIIADGSFLVGRSGWHDIGQEKGLTRSVGLVLNPSGRSGPRLSIDASRVEIRDEIGSSGLDLQQMINTEERYPNRVIREPLSATDAALGYTAGRIVALYGGLANVGRTIAETVDFQFDWTLPPLLHGETQLYGAATWQPTLRTRRRPGLAWLDRVGFRDGPLEWRGVAGVQWTRGPLSMDLNAQYMGRSSPLHSAFSQVVVQNAAHNQARTYIPSRIYLDLTARRRFEFAADHALRSLDVRIAVQNLLDTTPPIVADANNMGYDYRSDPRRRRFEISFSGHF
ncbi:TonB-dependent receptor [Caulobacter sp.]|uniref:TonB-dependent receptor n=1 Tax=Caulobacter sp. TaxID=78 RepID=UPI002B48696C|nr:TonB-dependent receptor [Caulobacter sp.]HJV40633.1 TonB-dependent receptor [Caulobacter sp.]